MHIPRIRSFLTIIVYFEHVHPISPFLDRSWFEEIVSKPDFATMISENKAWSALYHAVLALGSQYAGGGSFEPGKGLSWRLFSVSLSLFPDLLILPDSLLTLEAVTAMAIFALNLSCLQIERIILSEAARRAQNVNCSRLRGSDACTFNRTFWVLYSLEKTASFYYGRSSVSTFSRSCLVESASLWLCKSNF